MGLKGRAMADKILVAGGAGFLGSHIVDRLVADDYRVFVLDDLSATGGSKCYVNEKAQLLVKDARQIDPSLFSTISDPFNAVINLIAQPFIPSGTDDPESCASINVMATTKLLNYVRTEWFIQWSSSEVYGSATVPKMSEAHPLRPQSFYASTKLVQEVLAREICCKRGVPWTVLRPFNTFGPRETHPYVIPEVIRQAAVGEVMIGNQTARRDFTYVGDLARAVSALLMRGCGEAAGRTLNIATGEDFAVYEVISIAAQIFGRSVEIIESKDRMRNNDVNRLTGDASEFTRLTGWMPEVEFRYGMRKTIEWFTDRGKWVYENGG